MRRYDYLIIIYWTARYFIAIYRRESSRDAANEKYFFSIFHTN